MCILQHKIKCKLFSTQYINVYIIINIPNFVYNKDSINPIYSLSNPCFKSAIKSSASSNPTDILISPSLIPALALSH